jgi:gas vesicle protein
MNNNQKMVMGTLGAALAGAAAGVLLAPKKGADTRNTIKTKANDLTASTRQTLGEGYEKSKKAITDLTEKVKIGFKTNGSSTNTSSLAANDTKKEYATSSNEVGGSTSRTTPSPAGTTSRNTGFDSTNKNNGIH